MSDLATLQTRLAEAEAAYHQLMTGSLVESVSTSSGRQVKYKPSDAPQLQSYIAQIKGQIAALSDIPAHAAAAQSR